MDEELKDSLHKILKPSDFYFAFKVYELDSFPNDFLVKNVQISTVSKTISKSEIGFWSMTR